MVSSQYAYLLGNLLIFFPIWFLLFISRKDLRRKILVLGILSAVYSPLAEIFCLRDYWIPSFALGPFLPIEDFLFGLFSGGIGGVLYQVVCSKKLAPHNIKLSWLKDLLILTGITFALFIFLNIFLKINSIYAMSIAFLVIVMLIVYFRRDLWLPAIINGFLFALLFCLGYQILLIFFPDLFSQFWQLTNVSGIFILRIPLEEIIWALSWGAVMGIVYEFSTGLKIL